MSVYRSNASRNHLAGMNLLDALDDDEVSLLQALRHNNVAALLDSGHDAPLLDLFVFADHHDVATGLVELDRRLRNDKGRLRRAALDQHADDSAGDQHAFGICQLRAHQDGVCVWLNLNIEEIGTPGMRIHTAVR